MPIWKLTAIDPHSGDFNADFEKAFGFVIRADTEDRARQIATEYGGLRVWPRGTGSSWPDRWRSLARSQQNAL